MEKHTLGQGYSVFWPLVLLGVSVVILLTWNLYAAVQQHGGGVRLRTQQLSQIGQAVEVEDKLRAVMSDLIELSKRDANAARVVKKYNITITPPAAKPEQAVAPAAE